MPTGSSCSDVFSIRARLLARFLLGDREAVLFLAVGDGGLAVLWLILLYSVPNK